MADSHHRKAMAPPADMAYRTPAVLPFELIQHIGIFFEENLYTQGLNLLYSTLSSGTYASQKAFVPLPQHIALAVTLLVHPSTTTRAKSPEAKEAASVALRLLRLLSTLVNPHDCRLNHAFVFTQQTLRSGRSHHTEDDDRGLQSSGRKPLNLEMGQGDSLWARAEDFWHAVGWAFNCSVLHPERWERWQVWLHYMCEIMEDDWEQRLETYHEFGAQKREDARTLEEAKKGNGAAGGPRKKTNAGPAEKTKVKAKGTRKSAHDTEAEEPKGRARRAWQNGELNQNPAKAARKVDEGLSILRESLIFQFIAASNDNGRNRRILRAIFADGSTTSINEFRQVFRKELKARRAPDKPKKREREVHVDKEQYGDYMSQEETDDEVNGADDSKPKPIRRSKRTRRGTRTVPNGSSAQADTGSTSLPRQDVGLSSMGGLDSLRLRKRLLGILSAVSFRLPQDFISVLDLYNLFSDNIGPQPLPIFQAFVSPSILPEFADEEQTTLCEILLYSLREASAPSTDEAYLDQSKLEKCFLPYAAAASSVVSNIKVSILLEAAIVLLGESNRLTVTDSFMYAVEAGIDRRVNKASAELQRSQTSEDQSPEWSWLVESCNRLTFLTELLSPTA
ncbi:hypothetical protein N7520_001134 [Penicillium odoratum]|uniref:uncharacterized protein n=1 Tax=Penicillium odoratum TaxID=1167516 RepID=UPI0025490459|nr:uncharacterized protein N7520_001134 [Penicillium odoratum]KAJ5777888.1 hypothetical protein N7520_001134 [Penicillium odoratum]